MRLENELFYCENISFSRENIKLIENFSIQKDTGYGLEAYLKSNAITDEKEKLSRTYLVKDKFTNELVGYFSVKAGMVATGEYRFFLKSTFDSAPGIELANFGINDKYKETHPSGKGVGKIIFIDFILPICRKASDIIGAKFLYIFALPYPNLIEYYKSLNFDRLSKREEKLMHRRIRPRYDDSCIFMFRSISEEKD